MKVYKFFKIPSDGDDRETCLEDKYILYAITNNKEYAKRFKEDRNMDKFIYQVNKDVTKEEYSSMCNENRGAVLMVHTLDTVKDGKHTKNDLIQKQVLITYWEKQLIEEPLLPIDDENMWSQMPFPFIFKKKYIKALRTLQYVTFYKLMTASNISYELAERLHANEDEDDDYSAPSIVYDELMVLIHTIKDTL